MRDSGRRVKPAEIKQRFILSMRIYLFPLRIHPSLSSSLSLSSLPLARGEQIVHLYLAQQTQLYLIPRFLDGDEEKRISLGRQILDRRRIELRRLSAAGLTRVRHYLLPSAKRDSPSLIPPILRIHAARPTMGRVARLTKSALRIKIAATSARLELALTRGMKSSPSLSSSSFNRRTR